MSDALRDLSLVGILEGGTVGIELVEIARHLRRIDRGIEVCQIPFRQFANLRRSLFGRSFRLGPALAANLDFAGDLRTADEREAIFQSVRFKIMQDA